jgi:8-oxo-dGTP pyrophosphatase MutT (NUDIX family)
MVKIVYGERIGKEDGLEIGCSAFIFDATAEKVLLVQRADNGRWAIPGGYMEPGETPGEAAAREVWEETGLTVSVGQLAAVYSNPICCSNMATAKNGS